MEQLEGRCLLAAVDLAAAADNTLYESSAGSLSNGGGDHFFVGRTGFNNGLRRGVIKFDVQSAVPPGATIQSATLTLHMSRTISGDENVSLFRLLADWGEGASNAAANEGNGANAQPDDATWLHRFFDNTFWSQAGADGDYAATASAVTAVGGTGFYEWSSEQLVNDIQMWVNDAGKQSGWLLKGNESTNSTAKRFDSRENSTASFRPVLHIEYVIANDPPTDLVLDNTAVSENNDISRPVLVGNLTAVDADTADTHTYSLVVGQGSEDNDWFQISGEKLEIRAGVALDHETKSQLAVRIKVTDFAGASLEKPVTITVTDVNDPPQIAHSIADQYTLDGSTFQFTLPVDTFVDQDQGQTLSYSATRPDGSALPSWLSFNGGQRTFQGTPGEVDVGIFKIHVTVTDSGIPGREASAEFTLIVARQAKPWQNPVDVRDVNSDGFVVPLDVLRIINELNNPTISDRITGVLPVPPVPPNVPAPFLDVNGDGFVTPLDALNIVNFLNRSFGSEGEAMRTGAFTHRIISWLR